MSPADGSARQHEHRAGHPPVACDACEDVLRARGSHSPSFLLLDTLRVPALGCDDHLEQFTTICGYTTADTPALLDHRPAGGVSCPSCRLAPNTPGQPVIPVRDGAVATLLCPDHQAALVSRFQTGLDTHHQLTESLDTS
ncbi:hypothetical protein EFA46_012750 (plasmid) [Halarchaeum sp. CBA1220]|uniref:hypothetical protein n=1 Tax=Halarchaeum sp. CBA1220 TaxID=1853682 RepID=UPI000F3A980B|nr:hypothetical protein [Halarchaeum sp. CBA1220]QLC35119.1 hypothetical protein EFA46_012750 [Halarchaeum sp. CBA1220]